METETPVTQQNQFTQISYKPPTISNILCCQCGIAFNPSLTKTNICLNCISNQSDITSGVTRQGVLNICRMCKRYLRPPWVLIERESRELLSLCLKKIRGLNRMKIIDASFVWTEEHSRRTKVKLTVQKEVMNNASIQQTFIVEFIEHYTQCEDCKKEFTPHTWGAKVQVRQKVEHKKTFFLLEQLILKSNAHEKLLRVQKTDEGLDFFYKHKTHALAFVQFLQGILPCHIKQSKQLISQDDHSNIGNYKFCWSVEIPPICRDDLVILPKRLSKELGGTSQLMLCTKLASSIHLLDTSTFKRVDMNAAQYYYYEKEIHTLSLKQHSTEFMVMDAEKDQLSKQNLNYSSISNAYMDRIVEVEVSRMSDWKSFTVKSHLGNILRVGSQVQGFDVSTLNYSEELESIQNAPEIILVRRILERKKRTAAQNRIWKLRRLEIDGVMVDEDQTNPQNQIKKKKKGNNQKQEEADEDDFEEFLDEVERDPEIRKNMQLLRNDDAIAKLSKEELERRMKYTSKQKGGKRNIVKVKNIKQLDSNINSKITNAASKDEEVKEEAKQASSKIINKENQNPKTNAQDDDDDEDYKNEVKLFELMADLKLDDKEVKGENENEDENSQLVDEFINKLSNVKIEK